MSSLVEKIKLINPSKNDWEKKTEKSLIINNRNKKENTPTDSLDFSEIKIL